MSFAMPGLCIGPVCAGRLLDHLPTPITEVIDADLKEQQGNGANHRRADSCDERGSTDATATATVDARPTEMLAVVGSINLTPDFLAAAIASRNSLRGFRIAADASAKGPEVEFSNACRELGCTGLPQLMRLCTS
jgi:hypothetical protein